MEDLTPHLSSEDLKAVLDNFAAGRAALTSCLLLKTAFLQALPFVLGGLAHPDSGVAAEHARKAWRAWQATSVDARQAHHRFTRQFFEDGELGENLRLQMAGQPLAALSSRYQEAIMAFRFCPCAERVIESFHKDIKLGIAHRRPRLAYMSLLLRQQLKTYICV